LRCLGRQAWLAFFIHRRGAKDAELASRPRTFAVNEKVVFLFITAAVRVDDKTFASFAPLR
jgi:hypothetical protein